ncbi:putative metal chaperone/GTPase [Buttiauxella ferragutiae ATCC 51602]|uniref:Metal chaperone/GTPase n=1 Tax=Buttiauxella ferragutiae ATCC 51602 TaxID=1354252 RepID=A0ABX2W2A5_9ENTR|nr:GTP-binding protein [Buttiauxella ferragutiae]OAT24632.1 putative metal chaperone/GTPase [Buttiauxella ferragutiae ATCC 51602]
MNQAVSVTLLTGFLGSGKTTLLNNFLAHNGNEPVAILENEFGAVNIDGALLRGGENVNVVELSNGCVCCSVRGEFTAALREMLAKRASGQLKFERLIVETTGLADPAPIVQTFFVDEYLRDALRLDAVIALADAEHISRQLDEHAVAAAQLGFADRILLTKADRVDDETKQQALERIHRINNKADIFEIVNGECPAEMWLDLNAFELTDTIELASGFRVIRADDDHPLSFKPFRKTAAKKSWDDAIQAHVFDAGLLDVKKIGAFMESCIARFGNDMLRYKGVLAIDGHPQRLIVQGVHKVVGFDYGSTWHPSESRVSRLVIIGRYLPIEEMRREFAATSI